MAKKVVEVEIDVNSKQVVDAKNNVDGLNKSIKDSETTTKDFGNKVKIEYNKVGEATDVLVNSELTLKKQIRAVYDQLQLLTAGGKSQSQEFTLLQRKYNDLNDNLAKNKVRSQELFGSLSMLPGPIGTFASSLQGGLDLLKTFSGYRLSDIKNQFKALGDDLKEIFKGFKEFNSKPIQTPQQQQGGQTTGGITSPSVAAGSGITESIDKRNAALKEYIAVNGRANLSNMTFDSSTGKMVSKIENLTKASTGAKTAIQAQTAATNTLTTAEEAATTATTLLEAALAALGIGIIIAGIVALYNGMSELIFRTKESTKAFNLFAEGLKLTKDALDNELITIQNYTQNRVNILKKQNATAESIRQEEINGVKKQRESIEREVKGLDGTVQDALDTYMKYKGGLINNMFFKDEAEKAKKNYEDALNQQKELTKKSVQTNQEILNKASENETLTTKQNSDNRLKDLDILIKDEQLKRTVDLVKLKSYLEEKARIEAYWGQYTAKQKLDQQIQIDKELLKEQVGNETRILEGQKDVQNLILATAKQGSEEYFNAKLSVAKIEYQKDKEAALLAGADKENKLIEAQVAFNGKIHSLDEEKIKQNEDSLNKLGQISIAAIKDDTDRQVAARQEKYNTDLRELEKEMALIKMSEESKAFYRSELREALDNDIQKIHIDELVKKYQSELTLLEAQQKNLVAGTKAFLDNSIAIEEEAYQIKLLNAQKNGEDKERIEKEHAENIKAINLSAFEAEKNLQIQRLGVIAGIGQSLQTLAGKNKKLAIAGIIIEKAASIGQIIANTGIANAKAAAVSPLTFGQPWVAINTIAAGLSIAASIKGAADAISQINSADSGSSGGATTPAASKSNLGKNYADGGMIDGPRHSSPEGGVPIMAEGGEAIMTRGSVTMFKPLLSMMNQMGGGTSFSKGAVGQANYDNPKALNNQTEQPIIKTYVVESELTTIQHRTARLKDLSTL